MSHTLYMTQPFTFIPSLTLIISGGRYNLWSYTLCSFLQYPITFGHKSLWTDQHCCQTQSTVFPQHHRPCVTTTTIKILSKHTNVYTSIASFQKAERRAKHYETQFAFLQFHFLSISSSSNLHCLMPLQNTSSSPTSKTSNDVSVRSCFYGLISSLCI